MLLWTVALLFVPCVGKTAWLSLQVQPDPVFEGDILTLRCWGRRNAALSQVKFYRDGKFLRLSKDNQPLSTGTATVNSSGRYSCTGQVTYMQYGSQRSAWQLLFSLHKEGHTLQDRSLHPELCIPAAEEGDSGLYWCKAALEGGWVQKQSPQLEVRVRGGRGDPPQGPGHLGGPADPSKLCGAPPLRSSFYLNGDTLRNHMAPHGGAVSFLFPVMSEQDAGDYTCEAENSVSTETSKAETLSVDGPRVLSAPTSNNWLVPWLPASLLGMMVIAAALLGYFRPWRKTIHCQNENDEGVVYSVVRTIPKESESQACPVSPAGNGEMGPLLFAHSLCDVYFLTLT
ncbi:LOW QUALITY PROTEIN: Fc receptor-like protein 6 [Monodon monoceros]|uniref:LOW QUALITY PROTEIN: Fc receptor-like protein 6 n=1 Tax=Monodon monoceros TaxID=40151 RepID=UPI0010FA3730|nr:LOW QUALITY PROTEIN: Fc receptor-like protein 6 [Monodon monoceros]